MLIFCSTAFFLVPKEDLCQCTFTLDIKEMFSRCQKKSNIDHDIQIRYREKYTPIVTLHDVSYTAGAGLVAWSEFHQHPAGINQYCAALGQATHRWTGAWS